nr:uncharacterized protein CFP56_20395 [Quercus suber]
MSNWHQVNTNDLVPAAGATTITLVARELTDIWRASPQRDIFTGPVNYQKIPISTFWRAAVSFSATWKTLYDQGGLLLVFPQPDNQPRKWLKAGIEFFNGAPHFGTVGCDRYSDWAMTPLPHGYDKPNARIEAVMEGSTLWIYYIDTEGKKVPLREVKWTPLSNPVPGSENDEMWVGVYAAKPKTDADQSSAELEVKFWDWELEVAGT